MGVVEIGDIVYRDVKTHFPDMKVYRSSLMPFDEIKGEQIHIIVKQNVQGTYWRSSFVEVNFCVPYIKGEKANLDRLSYFSKEGKKCFNFPSSVTGEYQGYSYSYKIESESQENDPDMRCYFINQKLRFNILNIL
jgi:hypothetical protein